jgi:hypothetical protein
MRGYEMPDAATGLEAIRSVMHRGLRPAVVRLYDELDTFINAVGAHAGRQRRPGRRRDRARAARRCPPASDVGAGARCPGRARSPAWRARPARDDGPLDACWRSRVLLGKRLRSSDRRRARARSLGGRGLELRQRKVRAGAVDASSGWRARASAPRSRRP